MSRKVVKIDLIHEFIFPGELTVVDRNHKFLIICGDSGRWIVLDNREQVEFLGLLKERTLGEALAIFKGDINNARYVVTQIIARNLEAMPGKRASVDGNPVMHLYLTNGCNMRCPHCYMVAGDEYENELTTEEIKEIIRQFKKSGDGLITLSGGEVALRRDLEEICLYAKFINQPIEILTNGIAWPIERIKTIAETLYRVQISIDGYDEETNSFIRGKGAFVKALETVDAFVNEGVKTEVAITPVYSLDLDEVTKFKYIDFAKRLESKYSGKKFKVQFNGELQDGREIRLTDEERSNYSKFIKELLTEYSGIDSTDSAFVGNMRSGIIKDNCSYGNLTIAANGDVYFCAFIPTLKSIGNIRNLSHESLYELSRVAKSRSNVDNLVPCNTCEIKYVCGGDCRIHHFPDIHDNTIDMKVQCARKCTIENKEMFYDLMIKNNEMLFL